MSGQKQRSKKRSEASLKRRPKEFILYLDRNLGNHVIANAIRDAGHRVEIHDDHLPIDAPDEDWISLVGKKSWVALTKDKNVRYRAGEIETIKSAKARVIVVRAKNLTGSEIANLLTKYHHRMKMYAEKNTAPFIASIDRSGKVKSYII